MLQSPRARLLAVVVLLAALFGLVVWHGTLDPAPDAGAYPGSAELAADYDERLGDSVALEGEIVGIDPVVIESEYGVGESIRLTVVGLDPDVEIGEGALLRVFGVVDPGRTIRAENAFVVPATGPLYASGISFLAGLWVLGRIVRRFRFDRSEPGLVRRDRPLAVRPLIGRDRSSAGGDRDA